MNNACRKGCLMIFDSARVQGYNPESYPKSRCRERNRGSFSRYILFPGTDLSWEYPIDDIMSITVMRSAGSSLTIGMDRLIYERKPDLSIHRVVLTHPFQAMPDEAAPADKIDLTLDEHEEKGV